MIRGIIALTALTWALPVLAQQQSKTEPAPTSVPPQPSINRRQMEEDIEVMRRLLAKPLLGQIGLWGQQCTTCHSMAGGGATTASSGLSSSSTGLSPYSGAGSWYSPVTDYSDPHDPHRNVGGYALEGSYLKGYGVAFQMVLPPQRNVLKEAAAPKGQTVSDWEKARRELHGEKAEPAKTAPQSPSLADVLLKVLAENGKHFEYLPENESLTVVVTFRGQSPIHSYGGGRSGPSMGGGFKGMSSGMGPGVGSGASSPGALSAPGGAPAGGSGPRNTSGSSSGPAPPVPLGPGGSQADFIATIGRDYELLGDLHVRQGKINEAIDAFSKAVNAAKTATIAQPAGEDAKANVERVKQRVRDLSVKLARVLLDAGRVDEAQKALVMDTQIKVLPPSASGAPPVPLPAKLTISAPKRLLEAVGSGKISYDEFRKQATIDYATFTEAAPPPAEQKKK
ncbi:MAG TPA: hypothetical protein VGZ47_10270 [Gemmataceae bacterium]|jgi:hypothetical protein|nr:hypothetical protein [Gemmataceae bacterium]